MEEQGVFVLQTPVVCDPVASFNCLVSSGRGDQEFTHLVDVLPVTAHCGFNLERWCRSDLILSRYWTPKDGIDDIFFQDDSGDGNHYKSERHHLTYGEVTPLGVRQLAYEMGIAKCDDGEYQTSLFGNGNTENNNDDDGIVFYDLGSGVGRLVTQIYMDQPDRVIKAIGVELAEERHKTGTNALNGIMEEEYLFGAGTFDGTAKYNDGISTAQFSIQLIHGDATEVDLDSATTHVFISSLCLPKSVLLTIQEKLLHLPKIRVIAALNRLDMMHQLGEEKWHERDAPIQMSWGAGTAKLYHKVT
uniref:Histone H3-K79 methyltransferase n=1 Tax=Pseudo-nitzschia australis TaxID=44445 RepID=A0A7S4AB02_9STRA|mmetsp:Transcript_20114/g.42535  ORF Transcript_20114/g.42535 Transcript_20114/m.42535 type:complete len:303 (-) Transcript_20114:89-997(-)